MSVGEVLTGVVASFNKGFGFIQVGDKLHEGDDNKPEEVFVHNKNVVMAAYQPTGLRRGMHVRFTKVEVTNEKNKGKFSAEDVRTVKGEPISWFERHGKSDREVFSKTFTGVIGNFDHDKKFGYLLPEKTISLKSGVKVDLLTRLTTKKWDFVIQKLISKGAIYPGRKVSYKLTRFGGEKFGATHITDLNGKPLAETKRNQKKRVKNFELDEEKRYTGRVLQFKANNFGFILPSDDLSEFNIDRKLWFKAEDVNMEGRPIVPPGMEVSFTLSKDRSSVLAKNISMPDGSAIVIPKGHAAVDYEEHVPRESFDAQINGEVTAYFWDKGFGMIKLDLKSGEIADDVKAAIKDEKVYFRWSDIKTDDKIVGIEVGQKVKLNLYKDKRGIGAENITDVEGEAISGADRKKATKLRRKNFKRSARGNWNNNKSWNNNKGKRNNRGLKRGGNWSNKWGNNKRRNVGNNRNFQMLQRMLATAMGF